MADEREILFTLNTVTDPQVAQQLKKLADDVKKAENEGTKAAQRAAKQRLDAKIEEVRKRANAERLGLQNDTMFMAMSVREQEKVLRNRQKLLAKFHADQRKARQKAAKEQEQELIRVERLQQAAANKIVIANERMIEGISGGTEALAKIGRGWTALGIVSGKTLEEQVQALIKIQATFDLVVGTIEAGRNAFKILRGIRNAVTAANAAQELAAAAAATSAKASAANAAALTREAAAANTAAVAHGRLASARLAQAASGTASAGQVAGTAAAASPGLLRGAGAAGAVIPATAGIAGLAALGGIAIQLADRFNAASNTVAGAGVKVGSFSDKIGSVSLPLFQGLSKIGIEFDLLEEPLTSLRKSTKDLAAVQEAAIFGRAQRRISAAERAGERQQAAIGRQLATELLDFQIGGRRGLAPGQAQLERVQGRESIVRERLGALRGRGQLTQDESTEVGQLQRELVDLAKQRRDVEFSIAATVKSRLQEEIRAGRQNLDLARRRIEVGKAAAVGVVERFGQLDREQQARILRIQAKVRAGTQLSRREAQVARQFGSQDLAEAARRSDIARGRAAGGAALAGGEVSGVRRDEAEQRRLEREIFLQQENVLNIDVDAEELSRVILNDIRPLLLQNAADLKENVARGVREELVKIQNQADEERRAARQGAS